MDVLKSKYLVMGAERLTFKDDGGKVMCRLYVAEGRESDGRDFQYFGLIPVPVHCDPVVIDQLKNAPFPVEVEADVELRSASKGKLSRHVKAARIAAGARRAA